MRRWSSIAQASAWRSCARRSAAARFDRPPFAFAGDRRRLAGLRDLEAASGEGVEQGRFAVAACVLADADWVLGDQPVAVELGQPVDDSLRGASGQRGPADQRPRHEPGSVEQREDGVVLVVEAGEAGGAVELVGGADLVDAVEERELAQAVGRRRVVLPGRGAGYPASHDPADRAVGEVRWRWRGLVVHPHLPPRLAGRSWPSDLCPPPRGVTSAERGFMVGPRLGSGLRRSGVSAGVPPARERLTRHPPGMYQLRAPASHRAPRRLAPSFSSYGTAMYSRSTPRGLRAARRRCSGSTSDAWMSSVDSSCSG